MKVAILTSESRRKRGKKKKGASRSAMLKLVMPQLSGSDGLELQQAIANQDGHKAERTLNRIAKKVRKELEDAK